MSAAIDGGFVHEAITWPFDFDSDIVTEDCCLKSETVAHIFVP